ncbi:MAG: hypothetical protein A2X61_07670 [Ignavibacteria bacterium GWB2_35_12]|nr:MAG: hypothetical protein A2X63_07415 [Ignavibacteria bacterium GWA2_35_8]OGU39465.1 MAG: hypothetical protein A2X61_07670 [Ignavibacteria bacterium GWB2_35_12]OGU90188.1 MAG: hypothetical protein A2220_16385 [Ignavibacteria bacterium RIFOXYA2_FULL_35_10]OGV21923.1 MAG: hypothetical protein A2475_09890 [Ignavibacteria bacterium RIFOXYC2_FULL_35_21]
MSENRIDRWIKQFPETDRIFILTELKFILPHRYFSKLTIVRGLEYMIKKMSEILKFTTPSNFLKVSTFIDHQPEGKSQKDFLALLRDISLTKFEFNLSYHNPTNPRYFIYLDDLLCTGDTLFKGLAKIEGEEKKGWLYTKIKNQTHFDYLKNNKAKLLILYFIIHKHNYYKFKSRLKNHLKEDISNYYDEYYFKLIENDFNNNNSKLDFLFPIKDNQQQNILDYSASLNVENDIGVYRDPSRPATETLFSSKENRIRFENIMLQQGMRLYELAGVNRNTRMRPLGYGLSSHKNFGFGTLCFSYRNVPFNTPLVFWYSSHNWHPLFERKFVSYGHGDIATTTQSSEDFDFF